MKLSESKSEKKDRMSLKEAAIYFEKVEGRELTFEDLDWTNARDIDKDGNYLEDEDEE